MISTNFIIGTGFIKCIPITRSGWATTAPICVIEIEEVFVAKMVLCEQTSFNCLKIFSFSSTFSVAASTTKSTPTTPSLMSVYVIILLMVLNLSSSVMVPLVTILSKFAAIVAIPLSNDFSETSISFTAKPLCANVCAIPLPIVPAPITAIIFIYFGLKV